MGPMQPNSTPEDSPMPTMPTNPEEQAILIRKGWAVGVDVRQVACGRSGELAWEVLMLDACGLQDEGKARSIRFRGRGSFVLHGIAGGRVPKSVRVEVDGHADEMMYVAMWSDGWHVGRIVLPGQCLWCMGPGELAEAPATLLRKDGRLRSIAAKALAAGGDDPAASIWDSVVSPGGFDL